jgi:hypothetical protein
MRVNQPWKQRLALSVVSIRRWARIARAADETSVDDNSAWREKNGPVENAHILEDYGHRGDFVLVVTAGAHCNVGSGEGAIVYPCEMRAISMEEA